MAFQVLNRRVAVSPPNFAVEKDIKHGVALAKQKFSLAETTVIFADVENTIPEGTKVYLRGDTMIQGWAKEVYELDGKKFIVVPFEYIVLVAK